VEAAQEWIRAHVDPVGRIETVHERPWATVLRVPLPEGRAAWFKACAPVQAFEPHLTAGLFARWPDRVAQVLGHDEKRGWLLLADAGTPISVLGNPPEAWLAVLPLYAELQRGECQYIQEHLEHHVPDLRVETLPTRYEDLLRRDLPLASDEIARLRRFSPRFEDVCCELGAHDVAAATVQHDDLHMTNVYAQGERLLVLDWGDASISHPFASLLVRSSSLRREISCRRPTPGFRDCATHIWNRGVAGWCRRSSSPCSSAPSRTPSPGPGSVMRCLRRRGNSSTRGSPASCNGPWLKPTNSGAPAGVPA
jgi:hypothetical protein